MNKSIIDKANKWINSYMEIMEEVIVVEDTIIEHQHCYSMAWCKKSEIDLNWKQKALWVGSGRLLISKDGEVVDLEGSAPGVDWIHHFELKMFGLEDFWILEIPYSKENISKLKSILKQSTSELLKLVNDQNVITFTEKLFKISFCRRKGGDLGSDEIKF